MVLKPTVILILVLPFMAWATERLSANEDSLQSPLQTQVTLDCGLYPFGFLSDKRTGWAPYISIHSSYARDLKQRVQFCAGVDYYRYHMSAFSNTSWLEKSAMREDIALYAGLLFGRMFEIGCGMYYTTSDKVTLKYFIPPETKPWDQSGWSAFRFFFTLGFRYELQVTDRFFLPVGLYYRDAGYGSATGPVFLKLGLGIRL